MNPALPVGLVTVLLLAGAVLAMRARARQRRRRWNSRPDSVAGITARIAAEHQGRRPVWPSSDRDLRRTTADHDQQTLQLPRVLTPQTRRRPNPRPR